MRRFLRSLFSGSTSTEKPQIDLINCRRAELAKLDDHELKASAGRAGTLLGTHCSNCSRCCEAARTWNV
jgi:hypothetical protein